jgi:hypothetical protein
MEGNGAGEHGVPHPMNLILASPDTVAADAVASACMGIDDVLDVTSTRLAQFDGIGVADLDRIDVLGSRIEDVRETFLLPTAYAKPKDRFLTGVHRNVDVYIGGACSMCWMMAGGMARVLANFKNQRFSLFAGVDPKFSGRLDSPLENVIFLGDCACAATGDIKEIRNRMLLAGQGLLAPGCPPYRPASALLEEYLIRRGLITREALSAGHRAAVRKTYQYYRSIDPTWEPEEPEE